MKYPKKTEQSEFITTNNGLIAKSLSVSVVLFSFIALYFIKLATQAGEFGPSGDYSTLENLARTSLAVSLISAVGLNILQNSIYWFWWLKKTPVDERQKAVRQSVFEEAYSTVITGIIIAAFFLQLNSHDERLIAGWAAGILVFFLPPVLAAWHKDS